MRPVAIRAVGSAVPEGRIDNRELVERFGLDVSPEWIFEQTGIESRHWLPEGQTTSDLLAAAARQTLERAGVDARELDALVVSTVTGDHPSPSTATIVARKIGARCMAFDLSAACAGFLYGLDLGVAKIRNGDRKVLVLAGDVRSRFVDPKDRRAVVLFADGAGGALLEAADRPGFLAVHVGAEGRERMGAYVPAGGAARPATEETVRQRQHYVQVDPRKDIFETFRRLTVETCTAALERAGLGIGDIDLFVTHQGNSHMVRLVAEALGVPAGRAVDTIAHHGNVASASVPLALADAWAAGRIGPGRRVLLTSVGAGYTFGAAIHQF